MNQIRPKISEGLVLVVKPTYQCNLDCTYCYIADKDQPFSVMSRELLEKTLQEAILYNHGQRTVFLWHGGEPLLAGLDFFKQALAVQNRYRQGPNHIQNLLQTNLFLLNEEWAQFFKENRFRLGISLDGDQPLHDQTRRDKGGKGTFAKIFEKIEILRAHQIPFGSVCILSQKNLKSIPEIYQFHKKNHIPFRLNPLTECQSGRSEAAFGIRAEEYGQALIELFDLYYRDFEAKIKIEPFDTIIRNFVSPEIRGCWFSPNCMKRYLSVGPTGDVFPCGRFNGLNNNEFVLGNISGDPLAEIVQSKKYQELSSRSAQKMVECQACPYLSVCHGGCMFEAYAYHKSIHRPDYFCPAYQMIFHHINKTVEKELKIN